TFAVSDTATCGAVCPALPGTLALDGTGTVATFVPASDLRSNGTFHIEVTSELRDLVGTPFAGLVSNFATAADRDDVAPAVMALSPLDGATGVALNASIRARFSQAINALTVTADSFAIHDASNAVVPCAITLSADDRTVTFTPLQPLAPSTTYTRTVTAALTDLAGHAVVGAPVVSSFTTSASIDVIQPRVATVDPVNGATNVAANSVVRVVFTEPVDPVTLGATTVQITEQVGFTQIPATLALDASGRVLTITPMRPLFVGTQHQLRVTSAVSDPAGTPLSQGSFTVDSTSSSTVAFSNDATAPTVLAPSPADTATAVATNAPIAVLFSEPMDPVSVTATTFSVTTAAGAVAGTLQ